MSVQVMAWVFAHAPRDLKPSEMLVAIALANHASSDGGHAYPGIQAMMSETRLSRRAVQTALRSLEDRGVVEVEQEATRRLPAMYAFPTFRGANPATIDRGGAQSVPGEAQILHIRGANPAVRGAEIAPKPLENHQQEPSVNPSEPPIGQRDGKQTMWRPEWVMPAAWREHARNEHDLSDYQIDGHWTEYRNHWLGEGAKKRKADWFATWRNWLIRAPRFAGPKSNGNAAMGGYYDDPEQVRLAKAVMTQQSARLKGRTA